MSKRPKHSSGRITPANRLKGVSPMPIAAINSSLPKDIESERRFDHEMRAMFEKGRQTGLAQGRKDGYESAREQLAQEAREAAVAAGGFAAQRLANVIEIFDSEFPEIERVLADQVVNIAIDLAKSVVRREIDANQDLIMPVVHECLAAVGGAAKDITVHLNPADLQTVQASLEQESPAQLPRLCPDSGIEPGGCRIESADAIVDGTLRTRWQRALASIGKEDEHE